MRPVAAPRIAASGLLPCWRRTSTASLAEEQAESGRQARHERPMKIIGAGKNHMAERPNFDDLLQIDEVDWRQKYWREDIFGDPDALANKHIGKATARRMGLPTAETFVSGSRDVVVDYLPYYDKVTLKPITANGSRGVRCLIAQGDSHFDVLSQVPVSRQEISERMARLEESGGMKDGWMLEELLLPPSGTAKPLDDFKFYCFHGEIACILHKENYWNRRWLARYKWYDANWDQVDVGKYNADIGEAMRPPESSAALSEMAVRASLRITVPFMRIDLYDTVNGPIFGEFTPRPGNRDEFSREWDGILRSYWVAAADRLAKAYRPEATAPVADQAPPLSGEPGRAPEFQ